MPEIAAISGTLTKKDIKRLIHARRTGAVGPTTVYYAGATAPLISASMGVTMRMQLDRLDYVSNYWLWLISSLIAAFAGISWYLIFMRWSYRHSYGRRGETSLQTDLTITDEHLVIKRGEIISHIGWAAISEIRRKGKSLTVIIDGAEPVFIPASWFGKDDAAREQFYNALIARAPTSEPENANGQTPPATQIA